MPQELFRLLRWNINPASAYDLRIGHLCSKPDWLKASLVSGLDQEPGLVLMGQVFRQFRKIRSERNQRPEPQHIRLAARRLSNLSEVVLAPIHPPRAVTSVAGCRCVNRVYDDSRALRMFDGGVQVWIAGSTSHRIDAARHQKNFVTRRARRPSFDQIAQRQERARHDPGITE